MYIVEIGNFVFDRAPTSAATNAHVMPTYDRARPRSLVHPHVTFKYIHRSEDPNTDKSACELEQAPKASI